MTAAAPVPRRNSWLVLAGFIVLCLTTGGIGGFATQPSIDGWYRLIAKPWWTPPDWVFGPVWTLLYIMIAVAAWLVWKTGDRVRPAMVLFGVQLALNLLWSLLFFGARSPGMALVEVVFLWSAVLFTMLAFFGRQTTAGWLFVPYLAWVSFAAVLNFAIWSMN
ncbi:TspO/MBR family protein [Aestuariivirga sp.]|jgi:tryptophan-rich sensory protein|uniref:TspO/MBR family protein n=1 Tax=Aestuariivirga sp. TaxID=2650926 RepID=UPI003784E32A